MLTWFRYCGIFIHALVAERCKNDKYYPWEFFISIWLHTVIHLRERLFFGTFSTSKQCLIIGWHTRRPLNQCNIKNKWHTFEYFFDSKAYRFLFYLKSERQPCGTPSAHPPKQYSELDNGTEKWTLIYPHFKFQIFNHVQIMVQIILNCNKYNYSH